MIYILFSALLFGFIHPGSKLILSTGIELLPFCLLYVGIRLLFQSVYVFKKSHYKINSRKLLRTLFFLGIVGASLQYFEFYGIADGLPVPMVTFLVYSHPIWTLILSVIMKESKFKFLSLAKVLIGIIGVYLTTQSSLFNGEVSILNLTGPILAGLSISFWVILYRSGLNFQVLKS